MLQEDRILGLDLGTNSLGWALLKCDPATKNITGIIDAGSRVFEAGMDGDIVKGRAESRCAARRDARSIRRNLERRRRRMRKLRKNCEACIPYVVDLYVDSKGYVFLNAFGLE